MVAQEVILLYCGNGLCLYYVQLLNLWGVNRANGNQQCRENLQFCDLNFSHQLCAPWHGTDMYYHWYILTWFLHGKRKLIIPLLDVKFYFPYGKQIGMMIWPAIMMYRTNARIYNSDFWSSQGDNYVPRDISATAHNIGCLWYLHYEEE